MILIAHLELAIRLEDDLFQQIRPLPLPVVVDEEQEYKIK